MQNSQEFASIVSRNSKARTAARMTIFTGFENTTRHLRYVPAILLALVLSACAAKPTVSSNWKDKESALAPYTRVLIVGVSQNKDRRLSFEESLAEDLSNDSVAAWASTRFLASDQPLDEATILQVASEQGADAIVVTRVTSIDITPVEIGGRSTVLAEQQQTGFDHTYRRRQGTLFQYDYEEDVESTYMTTEYTTKLHTDVYDAREGQLVYEMNSAVAKQETLNEVIRVLSDAIANRLRRDNVIQR